MNKCPGDKEAQEYTKWTFDLMKAVKFSDDDYEDSRNISTCAKYLSVSKPFRSNYYILYVIKCSDFAFFFLCTSA